MRVQVGFNLEETRKISWQADFPKTTECCQTTKGHRCNGESRLAFVAYEAMGNDRTTPGKFVADLHPNISKPGKGRRKELWLHDACCVAVYFCKKCLKPTAMYNQG
jgi:hypothetical protein